MLDNLIQVTMVGLQGSLNKETDEVDIYDIEARDVLKLKTKIATIKNMIDGKTLDQIKADYDADGLTPITQDHINSVNVLITSATAFVEKYKDL